MTGCCALVSPKMMHQSSHRKTDRTGESTRDRRDWTIAVRTASPGGCPTSKLGVDWWGASLMAHITTFPTSSVFDSRMKRFMMFHGWRQAWFLLTDAESMLRKCSYFPTLEQHQCLESAWFPSWECFILVRKLCVYTAKGFHSGRTAQEQIKDLKTEIARPWKGCRTFVLLECAKYVKIHH